MNKVSRCWIMGLTFEQSIWLDEVIAGGVVLLIEWRPWISKMEPRTFSSAMGRCL